MSEAKAAHFIDFGGTRIALQNELDAVRCLIKLRQIHQGIYLSSYTRMLHGDEDHDGLHGVIEPDGGWWRDWPIVKEILDHFPNLYQEEKGKFYPTYLFYQLKDQL